VHWGLGGTIVVTVVGDFVVVAPPKVDGSIRIVPCHATAAKYSRSSKNLALGRHHKWQLHALYLEAALLKKSNVSRTHLKFTVVRNRC